MIDSIDYDLIRLLEEDARQSSSELALQLNISPPTVRRRINNLLRRGVIRIAALPKAEELGLNLRVVMAFDVRHHNVSSVINELKSYQEIKWLSSTTGRFNVIAIGWFASTGDIASFMANEISKLQGVNNTETFVSLEMAKTFF